MKKVYLCECQRNDVSPQQFFSYCRRKLKDKMGCDIEIWASYKDWVDEENEYSRMTHDEGRSSICTQRAYEWQIYSTDEYNFILEFNFGI